MEIFQAVAGALAIVISLFIAWRQKRQLRSLEKIGLETADTARTLKTDVFVREIVENFFGVGSGRQELLKCVFPVYYDKRPLPFIVAGDYYALHVLQDLVGGDRLSLKPVPMLPEQQDGEVPKDCLQGDAIYLCTPIANRALGTLAPAVELTDDSTAPVLPMFGNLELPCWFAIDKRGPDPRPTKKIWIPRLKLALESGAEDDYRSAESLDRWILYSPPTDSQQDYAIIARLTELDRKIIVVAGIHQHGTWIGGDFLKRLAEGERLRWREVFLSHDDFVAVVWGELNSAAFQVMRCDVLQDYVWVRGDDGWKQVSTSAPATKPG